MEEINYTPLNPSEQQQQFAICTTCEQNVNDICNFSGVPIVEITTYQEHACPVNKWSE